MKNKKINVLVTRPLPESIKLVKLLTKIGYFSLSIPIISFQQGKDLIYLQSKLKNLNSGDFIFFLSKNVVYFAKKTINKKLKWPKDINYYSIGSKTALAINLIFGFSSKYPEKENSESLIKMINNINNISGKNALILCGNNSRNILNKFLVKKGLKVEYCECYQSINKLYNRFYITKYLISLKINTIVVTSGIILKRIYYLFINKSWLLSCTLIVVSKRLFILAKNLGWNKIYISEKADNMSILKVFQALL